LISVKANIKSMNLKDKFSNVDHYFSPKIIDEVNDQYIKVAKIKGQEYRGIITKMKTNYFILSRVNF